MSDAKKIRTNPGVTGIVIAAMLLASRYLGAAEGAALGSLNTVLVIAALFLCLHLVRRTSAMYQEHVWNSHATLLLFMLPVATLLATGLQFLFLQTPSFLNSKPFLTVLIFVSVPVFLCFYFLYVSAKLPEHRQLRVFSLVLLGVGIAYTVLRLSDAVLLPLISELAGRAINPVMLKIASWNTHLSFLIYVMAFGGFFLLHNALSKETEEKQPPKGD